jgi:hypothetical protein
MLWLESWCPEEEDRRRHQRAYRAGVVIPKHTPVRLPFAGGPAGVWRLIFFVGGRTGQCGNEAEERGQRWLWHFHIRICSIHNRTSQ